MNPITTRYATARRKRPGLRPRRGGMSGIPGLPAGYFSSIPIFGGDVDEMMYTKRCKITDMAAGDLGCGAVLAGGCLG